MRARAERETGAVGSGAGDQGSGAPGRRLLLVTPRDADRAAVSRMFADLGWEVVAVSPFAGDREQGGPRPDLAIVVGEPPERRLHDPLVSLPRVAEGVPVLYLTADDAMTARRTLERIRAMFRDPRPAAAVTDASPTAFRRPRLDPFVGTSEVIVQLARDARTALASESPVLIEGETGSGKGVLAEWLHRNGPRGQQPFIDLNCAGFSRELMDSELFGHERGAFTGAIHAKPGLLEVADGGTLFLDEIGDMEPSIQAKILKVIEEKRFRRIGENRERRANVRIIAATHRDLQQLVREGRFREDLYYRIGVLSLRIPPLRRRREDLAVLVSSILASLARDLGRPAPGIGRETARIFRDRAWPGNLRELRNTLERGMLAAGGDPIEPHHLSAVPSESTPARREREPAGGSLMELERAHIQRVLEEERHVERAARRLGIARSTLYHKLRIHGIRLPR